MLISVEFNKFYHALLNDVYVQVLHQADVKLVLSFEKFKMMLKHIDKSYPKYDGTKNYVSTRDIRNRDLVRHIDFIIDWAGKYGISPQIVEDEWNRIMQNAMA